MRVTLNPIEEVTTELETLWNETFWSKISLFNVYRYYFIGSSMS